MYKDFIHRIFVCKTQKKTDKISYTSLVGGAFFTFHFHFFWLIAFVFSRAFIPTLTFNRKNAKFFFLTLLEQCKHDRDRYTQFIKQKFTTYRANVLCEFTFLSVNFRKILSQHQQPSYAGKFRKINDLLAVLCRQLAKC